MIQREAKLLLMESEVAMETEAAPALFLAACDDDTVTVTKVLSTTGVQSLINYQNALGATTLIVAGGKGHEAVTKQLLEARCNVDLQKISVVIYT